MNDVILYQDEGGYAAAYVDGLLLEGTEGEWTTTATELLKRFGVTIKDVTTEQLWTNTENGTAKKTVAEIENDPNFLRSRIAELEAEVARLRKPKF